MKDSLSNLLCSKFYKFVEGSAPTELTPGQLVVAHTVYPPPEPWILKVENYNAFDVRKSSYVVKRFEKEDRSHMPIAELGLRSDENYYLYQGKERPLVVVKGFGSRWLKPNQDESLYLCAPIFSFKKRHDDEFRTKVMGFCFPGLFYLPSDTNGCTEECAVRFELIQPIARKALGNYFKGSPSRPVALSDEAYSLFANHIGRFIFSRDLDSSICEQMDAYRALILEALAQ
jgi:hypothetical protein